MTENTKNDLVINQQSLEAKIREDHSALRYNGATTEKQRHDLFAAAALTGLLSHGIQGKEGNMMVYAHIAKACLTIADAILEADK